MAMANRRKFTILHSNDMHGDFLAELQGAEGTLIGGLALLSGYINRVRREEENVLYVISGDMVQGSIIDAEYKGLSTMQIMNYLAPDVVTLGNHEFDYGVPQLLLLEKLANFPIVNANLYIEPYNKRLMKPCHIITLAGFDILFIGIITSNIVHELGRDPLISKLFTLRDAATEIGKIINAYKNEDIDLTVLLTHIGFDADLQLATLLKSEWGVDMIIGGHSHTILDDPARVNGILIAQAGVGTDQVGRFDIIVDDDSNSVVDWQWQLVPITSEIAEPDEGLQEYIQSFLRDIPPERRDLLCKFAEKLVHPVRVEETPLGNLVADALADMTHADLVLIGSGAIRMKELGPRVTQSDFNACFPFEEALERLVLSGSQLKHIFAHIMRPENRTGQGECFQVNRGVCAVYNEVGRQLESLTLNGQPIDDGRTCSVCLSIFHKRNPQRFLDLSAEEISQFGEPITVSTSIRDMLQEYFRSNQNLSRRVEGRLMYRKTG